MTTAQKVNGKSPEAMLADPNNVYVGRSVYLRSGEFAGQVWPNSCLGNPFRVERHDSALERTEKLFKYVEWLAEQLKNPLVRKDFDNLRGKNLLCWCVNWGGCGKVPLCHAAWLAAMVDGMGEFGVAVSDRGTFASITQSDQFRDLEIHPLEWVVIGKGKS